MASTKQSSYLANRLETSCARVFFFYFCVSGYSGRGAARGGGERDSDRKRGGGRGAQNAGSNGGQGGISEKKGRDEQQQKIVGLFAGGTYRPGQPEPSRPVLHDALTPRPRSTQLIRGISPVLIQHAVTPLVSVISSAANTPGRLPWTSLASCTTRTFCPLLPFSETAARDEKGESGREGSVESVRRRRHECHRTSVSSGTRSQPAGTSATATNTFQVQRRVEAICTVNHDR